MTSPAAAMAAYARARDAVLKMRRLQPEDGSAPSAYWAQELANIEYMIEATPLVVAKLRHHAFHITGIRPYDYRDKGDGRRERFEQRLEALRALGGDGLLVPEHPALGGFGFEIGGRLFNVDTLKFYEVLIGMERAGVLAALRSFERPVVCEVGAGWGGFAYQFKTLFPRTTYVIVDFPELFLFSATYLGALFPDARLVFCDGADDEAVGGDETNRADFVFVPHTQAGRLSRFPLQLLVNMVSFQEMTEAQVRQYAEIGARAGCPLLYSLNRERSPYNRELTSVSAALSGTYAVREVALLGNDYTSALKAPPKPVSGERPALGYRHLVGRLRTGPRIALGMTLYNNAAHLSEALESLLAQTCRAFVLVLLDDGSTDGTEAIARSYAARDPRIRYHRRDRRQGMVPTWRDVVEMALRECPSAEYFAWVSDHDRWHPRWLEALAGELDRVPSAVLAYPLTRRISASGAEIEKTPRRFDTAGMADVRARWQHFCRHGVGAGDMVYGLVRVQALQAAGVFRSVLRPDRLLLAELVLRGEIRQVPEVLWFRRNTGPTSIARQRHTLLTPEHRPPWFWWPPWLQHGAMLWREYPDAVLAPLGLTRSEWRRMLLRYELTYGFRHVRKSETSGLLGRVVDRAIRARKMLKHHYHHAVYRMLVAFHRWRARACTEAASRERTPKKAEKA